MIFVGNYGEAGVVDKYGPARGLPRAYSGHNAYGLSGPPPDRPEPVVVVGYRPGAWLAGKLCGLRLTARIDNGLGLDNDEQGNPVLVCAGTVKPWSQLWPLLRHNH